MNESSSYFSFDQLGRHVSRGQRVASFLPLTPDMTASAVRCISSWMLLIGLLASTSCQCTPLACMQANKDTRTSVQWARRLKALCSNTRELGAGTSAQQHKTNALACRISMVHSCCREVRWEQVVTRVTFVQSTNTR